MSKVNNTNELSQKGVKLPKGKLSEIAERFGVSKQHVCDVKAGRRNNLEILEAVVKEIERYNARTAKLRSRINQA